MLLGQTELSTELKNKSELVRDFFGRDWVVAFCEESDAADSANWLDAANIATLRNELRTLYTSNFSGLDPGVLITAAGRSGDAGLLPILDRFIEPDIEILEVSSIGDRDRSNERAARISMVSSDLKEQEPLRAETNRIPITSVAATALINVGGGR
jgi:hypothetical protein